MAKFTALAVAVVLLAPAATGVEFSKEDLESEDSMWKLYEVWGARYKVARDPVEKLRRFAIFKEKARRVYASHLQAAGQTPLGLNIFADLSDEEVHRDYSCRMTAAVGDEHTNTTAKKRRSGDGTLPLPATFDWRTKTCHGKPCLAPVKNQGLCGSCWAFAATAALESHMATRWNGNRVVKLSEQELVDCDGKSIGCKGGLVVNAFDYIMKNGLASSAAYPYMAKGGMCHATATSRVHLIMRGFEQVPAHDEFQLLQAVTYGPVAVSIAVGKDNVYFADYYGGLFPGPCGSVNDHEMLLVGYGYDYYILQNSFGENWGDKGYMLLPRNLDSVKGMCGILMEGASYPEVAY
ncbi:hypothetical protein PR202_ga00589 [Eleusine coracana subsp. coracana]|uniref:Uncharacterized protein n=1 Tax=Eleusine coracana subsp. coracana TaxID=191504 RepID=A0AAV5BG66_ELECO|nr:hypothetical protein PR202_ga00589 [Eleusine coracana subsp. coracana]